MKDKTIFNIVVFRKDLEVAKCVQEPYTYTMTKEVMDKLKEHNLDLRKYFADTIRKTFKTYGTVVISVDGIVFDTFGVKAPENVKGYKPCKNYETCKKYGMDICSDCPHGEHIPRID